jgi:hydrogenase maturation protein HypF
MTDMIASATDSLSTSASTRLRLMIRGAVQGVGFRPYVHRLAESLDLSGFVRNIAAGVVIEVEGPSEVVEEFLRRLPIEIQKPARIVHIETTRMTPIGSCGFEIAESSAEGGRSALIMPDIATCADCLTELFDPKDRRFRYPFTNCTHCGPRFSIVESIPYDRPNTSMRRFKMCPECQAEYDDATDRRFHAQPNACPVCGPHLEFWDNCGAILATHDSALTMAVDAIRTGRVVAIKGIGGFHLVVDAQNEISVRRLRIRKHREEKPLAIMMRDIDAVATVCEVSDAERRLLSSPAAPIVLLRRRIDKYHGGVASSIAPCNPNLGIMLPYSPLHHLLMDQLDIPIVATSGNRSDEPICTDEEEARERLVDIADFFLIHDRPIVRPVDDSVARIALGSEMILRRSRGYAPLPIVLREESEPVLAVGAHLKNTVALANGSNIFISQHIGDLETPEAFCAFEHAADTLQCLYDGHPQVVACDLHPDYLSTQYARRINPRPFAVQHHHAHIAACMAEHQLTGEVLGICWDGTGYGPDGTIWGGEFLRATSEQFQRVAHLRTFSLPGGSRAVREPRCSAFGLLYKTFGAASLDMDELAPMRSFAVGERRAMARMIKQQVNSPRTSSAGRLFDAVASLLDLRQTAQFEGQAAMEIEFLAGDIAGAKPYPFELCDGGNTVQLDWRPMVRAIVHELRSGTPRGHIAARFHQTLIGMILAVAGRQGMKHVVLTGGCFQNMILLEGAAHRLQSAGYAVYWPQLVPPNDGGIALGQAVVAGAMLRAKEQTSCA